MNIGGGDMGNVGLGTGSGSGMLSQNSRLVPHREREEPYPSFESSLMQSNGYSNFGGLGISHSVNLNRPLSPAIGNGNGIGLRGGGGGAGAPDRSMSPALGVGGMAMGMGMGMAMGGGDKTTITLDSIPGNTCRLARYRWGLLVFEKYIYS